MIGVSPIALMIELKRLIGEIKKGKGIAGWRIVDDMC